MVQKFVLSIWLFSSLGFANEKLQAIVIDDSYNLSLNSSHGLTQRSIVEIIRALSNKPELGFINSLLNKDPSCLKISTLSENVKGVHTGQLFSIMVKESCLEQGSLISSAYRPLYILKESTKGKKELKNLQRVRKSLIGSLHIPTDDRLKEQLEGTSYDMANVTFEDVNFILKVNHKKRYYSLLQMAPGKSLQSHLANFGNQINSIPVGSLKYTQHVERMEYIFYRIGYSLSKFHQYFSKKDGILGKGYIHGDAHAQNIFYDDETDNLSLIDNETFALSFKKKSSGINDIADLYLLHSVKTIAHRFSSLPTNLELNINDDLWHDLWKYLFYGYLSAHEGLSDSEKVIAYNQFRKKFLDSLSNWQLFDNIRNFKDQRMLKRVKPSKRRIWLKEKRVHKPLKEALALWLAETQD